MTAFSLAWRTARRYRARAVLAVVGVAVIGALNFDMLLLSHGLMLSFADLLNSTGYNVRIAGSALICFISAVALSTGCRDSGEPAFPARRML